MFVEHLHWRQNYHVMGMGYGASALFAALPIVIMFVLLGLWRKPAWVAALSALAASSIAALLFFHMPVSLAASAALHGAAFGLFPITWVIFWAIALFRLTVETGQLEIIKRSIGRLTSDPRLQALLVGVAFAGFLEGASGFGTPVAIAASLLIGLGFSPYSASAVCLLANTAPVAFGSLGIPVITLAGTTGLPLNHLSAAVASLCAPLALIVPAYLLVAIGGRRMLRGIVVPTILCGLVFALVQLAVARFIGPPLTDLLAAVATVGALVLYCRMAEKDGAELSEAEATAFARMGTMSESIPATAFGEDAHDPLTTGQVLYAWLPYGLLVICMLLWNWAPVQRLLIKPTITFGWPYLHDTVHRMPPIVQSESPYHAIFTFNWLAASGTACMVAVLASSLAFRISPGRFLHLLAGVLRQLILPTITVTSVLAVAFQMNYSGATATLGLALAATGHLFPFFSVLLGWLGVFLTGSDTSANALFGSLQVVTASRLGLSPVLMAAANSTGGVLGKMISLQSIAIAAGATKMKLDEQARLFRFTLKHSVVLTAVAGVLALLFTYAHWF